MEASAERNTDWTFGGLLDSDPVLPEEFYGAQPGTPAFSGERALMWAVLVDGVETYKRLARSESRSSRYEFQRIQCWVMRSDWEWPFSFLNLCATFGLDAAAVRSALRRWELGGTFLPMRRRKRFRYQASVRQRRRVNGTGYSERIASAGR
jgi:hypothetical protein